eukprot:COSAG01_NODE_56646_length_317_cov_0.573394_1_plen_57_part_01
MEVWLQFTYVTPVLVTKLLLSRWRQSAANVPGRAVDATLNQPEGADGAQPDLWATKL